MPSAVLLPQKLKAAAPLALIGHRHLRGARSSSEHGSVLTTAARGSDSNSALSARRWARVRERCIGVIDRVRGVDELLPRDKPRRLILPITALRETPISLAICAQDRPAFT